MSLLLPCSVNLIYCKIVYVTVFILIYCAAFPLHKFIIVLICFACHNAVLIIDMHLLFTCDYVHIHSVLLLIFICSTYELITAGLPNSLCVMFNKCNKMYC